MLRRDFRILRTFQAMKSYILESFRGYMKCFGEYESRKKISIFVAKCPTIPHKG